MVTLRNAPERVVFGGIADRENRTGRLPRLALYRFNQNRLHPLAA